MVTLQEKRMAEEKSRKKKPAQISFEESGFVNFMIFSFCWLENVVMQFS
jgi:hypothetical protein